MRGWKMMSKIETQQNVRLDWFKWLVIALLLVVGLVANYYYAAQPWPIRLLGWLLLLVFVLVVALQTQQGKKALDFSREARMELRKVHWPSRQETLQTTFIVATMVVVLALILWGIDGTLMWAIGWLMGQRG
jgi:preprotein translocase subunit SecE